MAQPSYCSGIKFNDLVDVKITDSHDTYKLLLGTVRNI